MKWNEVKIETASEAVEAISNLLMEAGASGVAIEDSLDIENFKSDRYGEILNKQTFEHIGEGAIVSAYFPETTFLPEILPTIQSRIEELPSFGLAIGKNLISVNEVVESEWATAWKKYYHPVRVTRFLTIVPSWETYQPQDQQEQIIILDPGMAFGTGTHPTTQLALQALELSMRGGETVVDVGTGSGVLSIASMCLGAKKVRAYDLDEVAVKSAKSNMALNPIAANISVSANNLLQGVSQKADLIVANILADIIYDMVEDAWQLLENEGTLIISGIIEDKKAMIIDKMHHVGFTIEQIFQQKDWYAMIAKKHEEE